MTSKDNKIAVLVVVLALIVLWGTSRVSSAIGNPFVPQHGTGLLPDNKPEKCWALTLRADGTYAAVEAPCKHPEKKQ